MRRKCAPPPSPPPRGSQSHWKLFQDFETKGFGESKLKKRCVISVLDPVDDDDDDDDQAPSSEGGSRR